MYRWSCILLKSKAVPDATINRTYLYGINNNGISGRRCKKQPYNINV